MRGMGEGGFELAAGGLVQRRVGETVEICIVHRAKYRDWVLPRGRLEKDEPVVDAGLRGVKEKTGIRGEIVRVAGAVTYEKNGSGKVVLFWSMRPLGEDAFVPTQEISERRWLTVTAALEHLSHEGERRLVRETLPEPARAGLWQRLGWWLRGEVDMRDRLRHHVRSARVELAMREPSPKVASALRLLDAAQDAASGGSTDEGFQLLQFAERLTMPAISEAEFAARTSALRAEVKAKLSSWRREAAEKLLEPEVPSREAVALAQRICDEQGQNEFRKLRVLERQLLWLATFLILDLGTVFALTYPDGLPGKEAAVGWPFPLLIVLLGILGGTISAFTPLRRQAKLRLPELLRAWQLLVIRPLVGGASALVVFLLLEANVIRAAENLKPATLLVFAFASGFTERFLVRAIAGLSGDHAKK